MNQRGVQSVGMKYDPGSVRQLRRQFDINEVRVGDRVGVDAMFRREDPFIRNEFSTAVGSALNLDVPIK